MFTFQTFSLFLSVLLLALVSGLFYGYSCSVNPGLGNLPDKEYLGAMQSINISILNPLFFMSFMGSLVILPVCTWLHYSQPVDSRFYFLLVSSLLYIVGVFGVTVFCNVPLNNMLANFDLVNSTPSEIIGQRIRFEKSWNNYHAVRTGAAVISFIVLVLGILRNK